MLNRGLECANTRENQDLYVPNCQRSVADTCWEDNYTKGAYGRFAKVIRRGDPLKLVSEFLDGVREALHIPSAIIKEEETHERRGWRQMSKGLRIFES